MAKRTAGAVRLISTIPRADLRSTTALSKRFKSARFKRSMSPDEAKKLAALVVQVRAGEAGEAQTRAVLSESLKKLQSGPFKKEWTAFFKKHGGESLLSIDFNEFDRPFSFLPFPAVKVRGGKAEAKFNFVRSGKEVQVDIHLTDRDGEYVGTVRKAVAPVQVVVAGGKKHEQARDTMTRMVMAGIQRHAKDMLAETQGIEPVKVLPHDLAWELSVLMTPIDVLRGLPVFLDFPWPKGIPVRSLYGNLNTRRVRSLGQLIREHWPTRFEPASIEALGRTVNILRFHRGLTYSQVLRAFSSALHRPVVPADLDQLMSAADAAGF